MFTFHTDPHHIRHPQHGWLTPELVAAHGGCPCGLSDLRALVGKRLGSAGTFPQTCVCNPRCPSDSAHPQSDWPHHVEVDVSTQLQGYTRLTPAEVAAQKTIRG